MDLGMVTKEMRIQERHLLHSKNKNNISMLGVNFTQTKKQKDISQPANFSPIHSSSLLFLDELLLPEFLPLHRPELVAIPTMADDADKAEDAAAKAGALVADEPPGL